MQILKKNEPDRPRHTELRRGDHGGRLQLCPGQTSDLSSRCHGAQVTSYGSLMESQWKSPLRVTHRQRINRF